MRQRFTDFVYEKTHGKAIPHEELDKLEQEFISGNQPSKIWRRTRLLLYALGNVRLNLEDEDGLTSIQRYQYDSAKEVVWYGVSQRMIRRDHLMGNIMDFGCGRGGSSIFLYRQGGIVDAVDLSKKKLQSLRRKNKLPRERIMQRDGLTVLRSNPGLYDMVVATGFGEYATSVEFAREFYEATQVGIREGGIIAVTSDLCTMDNVRLAFGIQPPKYFPQFMIARRE